MSRKLPIFQVEEIDLNLLKVFEAIYRSGSITAAAQHLRLTQPSLSHALSRMRHYCNDPLFVRAGRGVTPTAYAEAISSPIFRSLAGIRETLQRRTGFDPSTSKRVFSVAISDVGQTIILPPLIQYLATHAPGVTVRVKMHSRNAYARSLESGELDLAFGGLPELHHSFYRQTLFRDEYMCLARIEHPMLEGELTIETYRKARHILIEPAGVEVDVIEGVLSKLGITRDIGLVVPQYLVVRELVAYSDFLVTIPGRMPVDDFTGRIVMRRLPFTTPKIVTHQYWHRRVQDDPANAWLRRTIRALFSTSSRPTAPADDLG